ncbi:hypothetical protein V2J09_023001 [Rumex salicifolius]
MGFFGIGKRTEHHDEAGQAHEQPNHEPTPKPNFFSKILAGKQTDQHPHDPEAQQHNKQETTSSHPPKSFFAGILGNKRTQHHHGEAAAGVGHADEQQHNHHQLHPPKHFFARILHRLELFLRICTLAFLVAGVVELAVDQASNITSTSGGSSVVSTLRILDIASYKYILAAIIIGQTYITVQIVVSLCRMVTGVTRGFIALYFDFIGDKILSYLLATGAAAAYGASINMEISGSNSKGKSAANLVLIAFFFSAISSVLSSHSLPKHPAFL